jgi:hypothetical protein
VHLPDAVESMLGKNGEDGTGVGVTTGAGRHRDPETHQTCRHYDSSPRPSTTSVLILPLTTKSHGYKVRLVKPEFRQNILPMGLLVAAIVCGGISWTLDGTIFWVMAGVTLALIVVGIAAAMRTDAARRKRQ